MKKITLLLYIVLSVSAFSQVKGTVTDEKGKPIAFANIYVQDTYISTTSNEQGKYELNIKKEGTYVILYQYLGYKTHKEVVNYEKSSKIIDVFLLEENIELSEVKINPKVNPAIEIMKNAIANRKQNSAKTSKYKADFYSRGIFRIKDLPKTFMGEKIDQFDEIIDSTRSGILYLSETISKITYQKPNKLNEIIVASKVSGKDSGFSFNSAASANFDFYDNYLDFNAKVISPIADNAFNYYKYKFDGSFVDENNRIINKIKIIPRRETEPVMAGYIYIVDDSYAIYAVDVSITGKQMQNPALNVLTLKQNFSYNNIIKSWIKNTQTLDFNAGIFAFKFNGGFTYVYSNFEFPEKFEKKTFTNEVIKFEENANKKDDAFWNIIRPVPLTEEESKDYIKKDILQTKKKSQVYLDSIDNKHNKFKIFDIVLGYSYKNSFKKWNVNYDGFLKSISFNTVQGWRVNTGFRFSKWNEDKRTYMNIGTKLDYGFSENKLRGTAYYSQKFNNTNKSTLNISGGSTVSQFNANNPISNIINSTSSLFFKDNYMKLYEKNFVGTNFFREIINGLTMNFGLEYSEQKPLWNTSDYAFSKKDKLYTSNNPLLPNDYVSSAFDKYNYAKATVGATIKFRQHYLTRPDGKYNMNNDKYPTVNLLYQKAFAATDKKYEFDYLGAKISHTLSIGNKGEMNINLKGGTFFNADTIAFVDYKHFNGNQTHIGSGENFTNVFNLLPYYSASTNTRFFETHIEHNDKGFIMNKIPLLNKLQSQLVLGFHNLAVPNRNPYQEFSVGLDNLGFGKFRMFRVDYVRSYQNGYVGDGVVFGLKFLNILE